MKQVLLFLLFNLIFSGSLMANADLETRSQSNIEAPNETFKQAQKLLEKITKQADLFNATIESELKYVKTGPLAYKTMETHRDQISIYCSRLKNSITKFESLVKRQYLSTALSDQCIDFEKQRKIAEIDEKSIYNYGLYEYSLEQLKKLALKISSNQFKIEVNTDLSIKEHSTISRPTSTGVFNDYSKILKSNSRPIYIEPQNAEGQQ
jgi:hypothetical protein